MRLSIAAVFTLMLALSANAQPHRCDLFVQCVQGVDQGFSHRVEWVTIAKPCIMVWSSPWFGSRPLCVFRRGQDVEVSIQRYGASGGWQRVPGLKHRNGWEFEGYIPEWRNGPVFQ
jgi:hypothetical protein